MFGTVPNYCVSDLALFSCSVDPLYQCAFSLYPFLAFSVLVCKYTKSMYGAFRSLVRAVALYLNTT